MTEGSHTGRDAPSRRGRLRMGRNRALALLLSLLVVPAALSIAAFVQEAPVRLGRPSPRTIVAPEAIRVRDEDATQRARREAAARVESILTDDADAKAAMVQQVRDVFAVALGVRDGGAGTAPSPQEQVAALRTRVPALDDDALAQLVSLSDDEVRHLAGEAEQAAQQLARQRITAQELAQSRHQLVENELALRNVPQETARLLLAPILRDVLRPTVRVDEDATQEARERAAADVAPVVRTFPRGAVIVSAGQRVDAAQLAALRSRGLEGAEPWLVVARSLLVALGLTVVVSAVLRTRFPDVWRSGRRLLLLAAIVALFAATAEALWLFSPDRWSGVLYLVPSGAVAMLAAVLFSPGVASLLAAPVTILVAYAMPGHMDVAAYTTAVYLGSVPLAVRLGAWGGLTRVAWQSSLIYAAAAAVAAMSFGDVADVPLAMAAGLAGGLLTAVIVNGSLPFMESLFGIVTPTSLLRLSNRNHPLLRELEQKALGSYNHSIMVATLCERACRAIGADALLASTAALYHDIGKVRRPYFFVENQFGVGNPHDDLEPRVSAIIIQEHVSDGVEMARSFRLPPEIVEGIATHHGTTLVGYFHAKALQRYGAERVTEEEFRYPGRKPSSREMAVLMLADCCEGATRAVAIDNRNLTRADLEEIVGRLIDERIADGQLDESALTLRDLKLVRESLIETLVGVYHPRIAYPDPQVPEQIPDQMQKKGPDVADAESPAARENSNMEAEQPEDTLGRTDQ